MRYHVTAGFAAFFLLHSYPSAHAASFNCRLAKSADEVLICQDAKLAALDKRLAELYSGLRNRLSDSERENLAQKQRAWVKTRRSCGRDRACIEEKYTSRISQLERDAANSRGNRAYASTAVEHHPGTSTRRHPPKPSEHAQKAGEEVVTAAQMVDAVISWIGKPLPAEAKPARFPGGMRMPGHYILHSEEIGDLRFEVSEGGYRPIMSVSFDYQHHNDLAAIQEFFDKTGWEYEGSDPMRSEDEYSIPCPLPCWWDGNVHARLSPL